MEDDNSCNTSLVLGIGQPQQEQNQPLQFHQWFPSHVNHLKRVGDDDNIDKNARKKLRLTKEQSSLLEDSFKEHKTLTMTQKQELAEQLSLQPRQVEVWFQNRRARTKLKQTEVDCDFLKKSCENLSKENQRLKNALNELRSMKVGSPVLVQLPKEAARPLIMCPPCERVTADDRKTAKMDLYGAIEGSSIAFQKLCKLQTDK